MKKVVKTLLLSAVILGTLVGCQDNNNSTPTSSDISSNLPSSSSDSASGTRVTLIDVALNVLNVKRAYEQGESLDLTGLVVTAKYSDGTSKEVTDYVANPANGAILDEMGEINISITYGEYTKTFTVMVSKATKKAWTNEEAAIMSAHLHGEVLPYTGYEQSVVSYDEEEDSVIITGGDTTGGKLGKYQDALNAAGYVRNGINPIFEKAVNTNEGKRYVRVLTIEENGQFEIRAYDPYYYTFPTSFAEMLANGAFYSNDVPPAYVGADYYEASTSNLGIFCYTESTTAEADYTAALTTANWAIGSQQYKEHKYAVSPDGKYAVYYKYNTQYKSLDIYFGALYYWNTKVVEDFYKKYNGYVVNIPALNVTNGEYVFKESDVNEQAYAYEAYEAIHAFMYVYGATEQDLVSYADSIKTSGWEVEKDGNIYYAYLTIADKGIARLEFEYNAKYNAAIFTIYFKLDPIPVKDWPADDIAALLGDYTIGTVPAYTGANKGFVILNDMFGTAVLVKVEKGTEEAAIELYKTDLTNADYTNYDEAADEYTNPNSEIAIKVYSAEKGSFTIDFAKTGKTKTFPSSLISSYFLGSDTVPALTGANEYQYKIVGEEDIQITCVYGAADAASNAQGQYMTLLQNAEYTFDSTTQRMKSKNNQFEIYFFIKDGSLVINIHGTPVTAFVSLWPTTKIAALFAAQGYTDQLPSYDEICDEISADKNLDGSLFVLIETDNKNQVKSDYMNLLRAANFTYDSASSDEYDDVFKSPNNQYTVAVSTNRFGVSLTIKKIENGGGQQTGGEFPTAEIYSYFPTAENVLPVLEDENASFEGEYDSYYKSYSVHITFESEELATAAYNAYVTQLKNANFTEEEKWGGYATIYYSPDNSFIVWPMDDYLKDGEIYIDIYPGDTDYFG